MNDDEKNPLDLRTVQDHLLRLKLGMRAGLVKVIFFDVLDVGGGMSAKHIIVYKNHWASFSFVQKRHPSQRIEGTDFKEADKYRAELYGDIPVPMRHALAGWLWTKTRW